jgi:hypothetical protein
VISTATGAETLCDDRDSVVSFALRHPGGRSAETEELAG